IEERPMSLPMSRTWQRRSFDTFSLVVAVAAAAITMQWSFHNADPNAGAIWKQVLATSISYGFFLFVLTVAIPVRHYLFVLRAPASHQEPQS
ncbi:MAG: hypothetical protein ABI858_09215, partial [Pseudoxanthomonas sp.]